MACGSEAQESHTEGSSAATESFYYKRGYRPSLPPRSASRWVRIRMRLRFSLTTSDPRRPSLHRKPEQHENVNPNAGHGVPVPCRNIDDDAAGLDGAFQPGCGMREKQHRRASGEMQTMHACQEIDERTAGPGRQMKTPSRQQGPNVELSAEKQKAQEGGESEPGEFAFVAERNAGNGFHRIERRLACNGATGQFHGYAAHNQHARV